MASSSSVSPVRVGDLRQRIVIEQLSEVEDGQGGFTASWVTFATVWAFINPLAKNSFERLISEQIQYQRSHEVYIRYLEGLTNDMRFAFDDRIFQIKSIRKVEERKFFLVIDAYENQGT